MANLNKFVSYEENRSGHCRECGHEGTLEFKTEDGETVLLCGKCIYKSEGKFKNMLPGKLLEDFETLKKSYFSIENKLLIETTSFLGKFSHIFYLNKKYDIIDINEQSFANEIQLQQSYKLSGISEVYDYRTGEFVSSHSVYSEKALEMITEYNRA